MSAAIEEWSNMETRNFIRFLYAEDKVQAGNHWEIMHEQGEYRKVHMCVFEHCACLRERREKRRKRKRERGEKERKRKTGQGEKEDRGEWEAEESKGEREETRRD